MPPADSSMSCRRVSLIRTQPCAPLHKHAVRQATCAAAQSGHGTRACRRGPADEHLQCTRPHACEATDCSIASSYLQSGLPRGRFLNMPSPEPDAATAPPAKHVHHTQHTHPSHTPLAQPTPVECTLASHHHGRRARPISHYIHSQPSSSPVISLRGRHRLEELYPTR